MFRYVLALVALSLPAAAADLGFTNWIYRFESGVHPEYEKLDSDEGTYLTPYFNQAYRSSTPGTWTLQS